MKILFLMLTMPDEGKGGGMYMNLAEAMRDDGQDVTIMAPHNQPHGSSFGKERGMQVVRVKAQKTQGVGNMIKKGIALAMLPYYFKKAYNKFIGNMKFDWIIMPTPPITLISLVEYAKMVSGAKFYLILRDIHPQSVWSIGILKRKWMYNYLDKCSQRGYKAADIIGCMSPGNIGFVKGLYPQLNMGRFEVLYNWLDPSDNNSEIEKIQSIREKFGLKNKVIALFGGNIGLGQRIENIVALSEHSQNNPNVVIAIIGKGVEKNRLKSIVEAKGIKNILLLNYMPQQEYLAFVNSADIGLISINERYAPPTCPSKAISYMAMGIPIFAMINPNSDYGKTYIDNPQSGFWTVGGSSIDFSDFDILVSNAILRKKMGENGRKFYNENLTTDKIYNEIKKQINGTD